MATPTTDALYKIVQNIPFGRVTSYGYVAQLLDIHYDIHLSWFFVGKILSGLPQSQRYIVPWWRVVNKQWYISSMKLGSRGVLQRQLLEKEHIEVTNDCVDMKKYGWREA